MRPQPPMAKPPREETAPNLESSSKGEARHSDMAQKGQPELHIEADAADGHGEHEAPPSPHNCKHCCKHLSVLNGHSVAYAQLPASRSTLHCSHDAGGGGAPGDRSWMELCMALCTEGHTGWDCELFVPCTSLACLAYIDSGSGLSSTLYVSG